MKAHFVLRPPGSPGDTRVIDERAWQRKAPLLPIKEEWQMETANTRDFGLSINGNTQTVSKIEICPM
jgi:hypothetical protein